MLENDITGVFELNFSCEFDEVGVVKVSAHSTAYREYPRAGGCFGSPIADGTHGAVLGAAPQDSVRRRCATSSLTAAT
jgi:hypothetical protein